MTLLMSLMDSRKRSSTKVMSPQMRPFSSDKHPLSLLLGPQATSQTHLFQESNMPILTKAKGDIIIVLVLLHPSLTPSASK